MVIPDQSMLYQLVNFLFMWLALDRLLIRPIRGVIQKRKELLADRVGKIERFTSEAEGKVKAYEAALSEARQQGNDIRAGFKEQGSGTEQKLLSDAGAEASKVLNEARSVLKAEAEAAVSSLKQNVDGYAAQAAAKVLGQ